MARDTERLLVLDHHITAEKALAGLPYAYFDLKKSGAVLAWEWAHDHPVPWILEYIQDKDLWTWALPLSREINAAIAEVTRQKPVAYWVERLDGAGIPCGPINAIDQVFADPQVQHLGMAAPVKHPKLGDIKLVNSALNMQGLERRIHSPTPDSGADTLPVLKSLGYSDSDIEQLRAKGAI